MVQKPERGRYLNLEDVRVSYKHKDDTIHLTSSDPDIPNGSFYVTLNRGTSTEEALREILIENGLIKEDEPDAAIPASTATSEIEAVKANLRSPIPELFVDMLQGNSHFIFCSGEPGTGKGHLLAELAHTTSLAMQTLIIRSPHSDSSKELDTNTYSIRTFKFTELPDGFLNPFNVPQAHAGVSNFVQQLIVKLTKADHKALPAIARAIHLTSAGSSEKSLNEVIETLELIERREGMKNYGVVESLKYFSNLPYAKLLFGYSEKAKLPALYEIEATTSIVMDGIKMPDEFTPPQEHSFSQILAIVMQDALLAKASTEQPGAPRLLLVDNYIAGSRGFAEEFLFGPYAIRAAKMTKLSTFFVSHSNPDTFRGAEEFMFRQSAKDQIRREGQQNLEVGEFIYKNSGGFLNYAKVAEDTPEVAEYRKALSL